MKRLQMSSLNEKYVVDREGKKTAVILSLQEYRKLLEDLHDLAVVAERRDEETVSFDEVKHHLRENGLL
jgi:PHD/YefM family antitoxin component YafN of YafNO toxin-antitoxin module